mmetsp:Transcript_2347/g.8137  ORF Transcript_2347/g.8137 Transcript_2347/m.8137 type:complete len:315 (+) Transcript_2347:789-1733(+)
MLTVHAAPASERKIADYVCPLCDEVLSNPVMLPCEHRFCFKCITNVEKNDGDALEAPNPNERRMEIDDKHHKHGNSSLQDRWSKGALHRGACPVCREPNMNDESSLRVDDKLDEFIKTHFKEETFTTEKELSTQRDESDETMKDANTNANPASSIPKALIVVLAGCRSDAMLVSDAPTMSGFVRGSGCFSFHMAHTSWNGCGNTSSDAMMPLLTGSQGASLTGKPGAEKVYKKTKAETKSALKPQPADTPHTADVNVSSVFSRLSLVRSWVKVVAAIGGASDLAATIAAEHATEVVTDLHADDAAAAAAEIARA